MATQRFHLFPTASSGLSKADYEAYIPAPKDWDLSQKRQVVTDQNLDGTFDRSPIKKDPSGLAAAYEQTMTEAEYESFSLLDDCGSSTSWMLAADGRMFEVILDIEKAQRVIQEGKKNVSYRPHFILFARWICD